MGRMLVLPFHLLLLLGLILASPNDHLYNIGNEATKLVPSIILVKTYQYYDLPFCQPGELLPVKESLGEVLNRDRLTNTLYQLKFGKLNQNDVSKFRAAIIKDYYYQMYFDDLPFWGFAGKIEDELLTLDGKGPKYFLLKHVQFDVLYNGNQVIEIHALSDPSHVVDVTEDIDQDVTFTYNVSWNETSNLFKDRMARYSKALAKPVNRQVHWFSVINSTVISVLLMAFFAVSMLQRLKNDLRQWSGSDEEEDKEVGWKYLHGDFFRCPSSTPLLCAVIGAGTQLLTLFCCLFILAFLGVVYPYNRGALLTSLFIIYTLTSAVAGYSSASFYSQFVETGWFFLNSVVVSFGATLAIPFGTIVVITLVYMVIAVPLLALGGLIGYLRRSEFHAPPAIKKYMFLAGLLPFSATVVELHQVYATLWGYEILTLPGLLVYFPWGLNCCIHVYSIYFYCKSNMSRVLQTTFFVYNTCICYAFFLMLGTTGLHSSLMFNRCTYHAVKSERESFLIATFEALSSDLRS
ncbi:unnamed protein product [Withania somnifera]